MTIPEKSKNIILGADSTSEYVAYGDDSKVDDYIVYSFVIIRRCDILFFEQKILQVKAFYGIPEHIPIHCSVLLSGDQRKKIGIEYLSSDKILLLFRRIIRMFNQIPICLTYTFCNYTKYKETFLKYNVNDHNLLPKIAIEDYKGILGLMANFSINATHKDPQIPRAHECQIIVSSDRTPVSFAGDNKKQAHKWIGMPTNFNNSKETKLNLVQPLVLESKDSIMLQVADIAVYMCAKAKSEGKNSLFFRKLLKKVKHFTESEFFFKVSP